MDTKKIILTAGATVLTVGLALPASALTIEGAANAAANVTGQLTNAAGLDGSAGIDADVSLDANSTTSHQGTGASATGQATVTGNASAGGDSGKGIGTSIRTMLNSLIGGSVSTGSEAGSTSEADTTTRGSERSADIVTGLSTILVTRADVDGGNTVPGILTAASVITQSDLKGFVAAQVESDSNVESIELASDSVAVTYKDKAHLFGVIPVTVDATATVDASGNVEVSYPWYGFLMATDKEELEAKIENRVRSVLGAAADISADADAAVQATASGSAETGEDGVRADADARAAIQATAELSARTQARLVAEVKAAMAEALAEADGATDIEANANTDVSANGSVNVR